MIVRTARATVYSIISSYCPSQVALCQPSAVHICDGSEAEAAQLSQVMVNNGTWKMLTKYENW